MCIGVASHPGGSSNTPRPMLYAKDTGISSGRLGLWLMCTFAPLPMVSSWGFSKKLM